MESALFEKLGRKSVSFRFVIFDSGDVVLCSWQLTRTRDSFSQQSVYIEDKKVIVSYLPPLLYRT